MCRFLIYQGSEKIALSNVICEPSYSLLKQAVRSRLRLDPSQTVNADGFGVGWYTDIEDDCEACILTSVLPAWNSINLDRLAPKIKSKLIFAHVRAATRGPITETDCHPFELGHLMWMHNGSIGHWEDVKKLLANLLPQKWFMNIRGHSDSEWAFALFLSLLEKEGFDPFSTSSEGFGSNLLRKVLIKTIKCIGELVMMSGFGKFRSQKDVSYLNFAVSDGHNFVVSRFVDEELHMAPSLFYCRGSRWEKNSETGFMMSPSKDDRNAIVVASEPLTHTADGWIEIPTNSTLTMENGEIKIQKIDFGLYSKKSNRLLSMSKYLQGSRLVLVNTEIMRRRSCTATTAV